MKLFHISDLHLGKRVHEFSMIEDQRHILRVILEKIKEGKPDALLISGDVYDKPIPTVEAVSLLDDFLMELSRMQIRVYLISGNHDSAERLHFASGLLEESGIYLAGMFEKDAKSVTQQDEFGDVVFTLIPFIKPAMVVSAFGLENPMSYEDAFDYLLNSLPIDEWKRNVLLAHQFVTWRGEAERSESETYQIGGVDEMDASIFSKFDYVALGHLHAPQRIGRDTVRYAGSPLAYSFSEVRQKKGITVIELKEKGDIGLDFIPLNGLELRKMREIKGPLVQLIDAGKKEGISQDYIRAILTDDSLQYDPIGQLRAIYPNLMTLEFEKATESLDGRNIVVPKEFQVQEMFEIFYEKQHGKPMSEDSERIVKKIWSSLDGEDE